MIHQSHYDVLVIGAGAAGLYTALCLPAHLHVGVVSKEVLSLSASDWAQGGIAAVIDPQDSTALHVQDTLAAGAGLCDLAAVQFLVEHAPVCIQDLVQMGVGFDRQDGTLALTLEAAHSRRRVLHAADTTGRAVVSTLVAQVLQRKNIQVIQAFTLDVWLDDRQSTCQGVSLLIDQQVVWLTADAVILATGGGGQVFAQTTNPRLSTGDGVAIAHRAGALLRDLEFVQFHPTALTQPGAPRFLISEAVRGEGAHLVDAAGHRFAFDYHPDGELAPRDVVSRAIYQYLQTTHADPTLGHVWLDLRPIPRDRIQHRFPNILQVCQQWGVDPFTQPIPVAPAAHYWMGGIATDLANRTSLARLYAVGETASTGVHGANRLASNSLLECLVFGAQFRQLDLEPQATANAAPPRVPTADAAAEIELALASALPTITRLRQEIPRIVWQYAGICRDQAGMTGAIAQLHTWQTEFAPLPMSQTGQPWHQLPTGQPYQLASTTEAQHLRLWAETRNLLTVAELILRSAQFRTESRGGHFRTDFPQPDPAWQHHTLVQGDRWFHS
jgi:L-aspartate oxidase